MTPILSVVMAVFNGENFLQQSINSVLEQTFTDFEFIIVNDGSTDGTENIVRSYKDPRIVLINQSNSGLALSLNTGIRIARGKYIARQDADDVCMAERFNEQIAYLDKHPECGMLGTWSKILHVNQLTTRGHFHPLLNGSIQIRGLFDSFFVHSTVMIRTDVLKNVGMYPTDPMRNPPEDFDLWLRVMRKYSVANISRQLLYYRELPNSISRAKSYLINERAILIACENIQFLLPGINLDPNVLKHMVAKIRNPAAPIEEKYIKESLKIIDRLAEVVRKRFADEIDTINREVSYLKSIIVCKRSTYSKLRERIKELLNGCRARW